MRTRSQNISQQSDLDQHSDHSPKRPQSHFKMNDRIVVYNKQGLGIHGTVKWIECVVCADTFIIAIGIETVWHNLVSLCLSFCLLSKANWAE